MNIHTTRWTLLLAMTCSLQVHSESQLPQDDTVLASQYSFRDFFMQITGLGSAEDLRQSKDRRQESIKILGAGFSRTGTTSLALALSELGYNVYDITAAVPLGHMETIKSTFIKGESAARELREAILSNGYNATLDMPVSLLWKELRALDPDAKVLLTVRDSAQDWADSYQMTVDVFAPVGGLPFSKLVDFSAAHLFGPRINCMSNATFWTPAYLPWINFMYKSEIDKEECKKGYEEWIQEAKRLVPETQLLIFNVKQGWEPLCRFLGKPVPETPFPRVNTRNDIAIGWYAMRIIALTYPFLLMMPLLLLYCCARCCCAKSKPKSKVE